MAFFQFRFPGKSTAAADNLAASPGESLEVLRRRARHRLLGAVVLVFVAVVAFPLLFDSQPRPVAIDTPIVIPDRNQTTPLTGAALVPPTQAPAKPLLPAASQVVPVQSSLEPGKEEVVLPVPPPLASAPAKTEKVDPAEKTDKEAVPADKPADTKPKADKDAKTKIANDGQKAKALLEGKAATADAGKHIIQVGAFADADKVREVRRKLEHAGLKTYTQSIEAKDGKRTTRVRVGPFESRAEAEKAAARVRKLDLPAHLVAL